MELLDTRIILVILLNVCLLDSQMVQSPCRYFEYKFDRNGYMYGFIKIDLSGPVSGVSTLINFTVAAHASHYGSIEYLGLKDSAVTYKVHFPLQHPVPKITQLVANNNILCQAPGDILRPGVYISTFGLIHQVTFGSDDFAYGFNRPQRPDNTIQDNNEVLTSSQDTFVDGNPLWNTGITNSEPQRGQPNPNISRRPNPRPNATQQPVHNVQWETPSAPPNRPEYEPSQWESPSVPTRQPATERPSVPRRPVTTKPPPVQRPTPPPLPPRPSFATSSTSSAECGIIPGAPNAAPLVFQGDAFEPGEWPWLVAIYLRKGGSLQYICAGSLVSDMHVVTAAHCMQLRTLNSHKDIVVRAGVHNIEDWGDENSITRTLASARIHESYTTQNLANDILVLTFNKRIEFTTFIRAICLWEGNNDQDKVVGKYGVVAGWGDSEHSRSGRGEPRAVRLKIVSTNTCRNSKPDFEMLTSSYTLCAGERNGAGPCFGDSGAGMYLREGGRWKLRGVVSLSLPKEDGEYNCNLEEYLVFTDAAQYLSWITDKMQTS